MKLNYTGMYGKGKVQVIESNGNLYCQSYNTIVCGIVKGKLQRYWDGYSKTTMAHICQFITDYNIDEIVKGKGEKIEWAGIKTWESMKVKRCPINVVKGNVKK